MCAYQSVAVPDNKKEIMASERIIIAISQRDSEWSVEENAGSFRALRMTLASEIGINHSR